MKMSPKSTRKILLERGAAGCAIGPPQQLTQPFIIRLRQMSKTYMKDQFLTYIKCNV